MVSEDLYSNKTLPNAREWTLMSSYVSTVPFLKVKKISGKFPMFAMVERCVMFDMQKM